MGKGKLKADKNNRRFFGKISNYEDRYDTDKEGNKVLVRTAKEEQAFEKRHLKAYLKGDTQFKHGDYKDYYGIKRPLIFNTATEEYNADTLKTEKELNTNIEVKTTDEEEKDNTIQEDDSTNI